MSEHLNTHTACELAHHLAHREITAEAIVRACIERIEAREPIVGAWAHFDATQAIAAARALDRGPHRGPLHGIPFAVKDIIDTIDYPTECGTPIYAGRRTPWDAACVAAARAAGGIILGKTVTTELAYFSPGKTANPHNPAYTPGGSSSGSAAAVADRMVPLAFGTQTGGSIIRPAAFCGVVGYKPTFNLVARGGVKSAADSLDTIGFFANSVDDAALIASVVSGRPALATVRPFASKPRIGICRSPEWSQTAPETVSLFDSLGNQLRTWGAVVSDVALPEVFEEIGRAHHVIMAYEMARNYAYEWHAHRKALSEPLTKLIEDGLAFAPELYDAARAQARRCRAALTDIFRQVDVLATPSAVGEAPATLANTGSPAFNRLWTLMGTPAVTVPAGRGPLGLPLGVQFVGPLDGDALLLSAARWLEQQLAPQPDLHTCCS